MKVFKAIIFLMFFSYSLMSHAADWKNAVGLTYASGIQDVADFYERYLEQDGFVETEVVTIPVGISYRGFSQFESGLRLGAGVGPVFLILGDVEHTEVAVNAHVGYTLFSNASVAPYVNLGVVHHFVSGDLENGSSPGLLAAIGIEFNRNGAVSFVLELAVDKSEVTLFDVRTSSDVDINTYDTTITFALMF